MFPFDGVIMGSEVKSVDMNTSIDYSWKFDLETYGDTAISQAHTPINWLVCPLACSDTYLLLPFILPHFR